VTVRHPISQESSMPVPLAVRRHARRSGALITAGLLAAVVAATALDAAVAAVAHM
jgi:hypothetical protein